MTEEGPCPATKASGLRLTECRLRRLDPADRERLLVWRNSDAVRAQMFMTQAIRPDKHAAWFDRALVDRDTDHFVFEYEGRALGLTSLSRTGGGGLYVGDPSAPSGSGSALLTLTLDHAFGALGLSELTYEAMADNARALALYRRFGFIEMGDRVIHRDGHSEPERVIRLALSARDWPRRRAELVEQIFVGGRP